MSSNQTPRRGRTKKVCTNRVRMPDDPKDIPSLLKRNVTRVFKSFLLEILLTEDGSGLVGWKTRDSIFKGL